MKFTKMSLMFSAALLTLVTSHEGLALASGEITDSYTMLAKSPSTPDILAQRCIVYGGTQKIDCSLIASLGPKQVSALNKNLQHLVHNQRNASYAIIAGGTVVGFVVGAAGGVFIGIGSGFAWSGASAAWLEMIATGGVSGMTAVGLLADGTTHLLFKSNGSLNTINEELNDLLKSGAPFVVKDNSPGSKSFEEMVLAAAAVN